MYISVSSSINVTKSNKELSPRSFIINNNNAINRNGCIAIKKKGGVFCLVYRPEPSVNKRTEVSEDID